MSAETTEEHAVPDHVVMLDLLGLADDEHVSGLRKKPGSTAYGSVYRVGDLRDWLEMPRDRDFWLSVITVPGDLPRGRRGTAAEALRILGLFADLDLRPDGRGIPTLDGLWDVVADLSAMLGSRPAYVVMSGHGLQPVWKLEDDAPEDCARARSLLPRWGALVNMVAVAHGERRVDTVFDAARVLRAPGTRNFKNPDDVVDVVFHPEEHWTPVSLDRLAEVLDEYAVSVPVRAGVGDEGTMTVPSSASDWDWAEVAGGCGYVPKMIRGWRDDVAAGKVVEGHRHHWAFGQHIRLVAARRMGCVTQEEFAGALEVLQDLLTELRAPDGPAGRRPGEVKADARWAEAKVALKSDAECWSELGGREHSHVSAEEMAGAEEWVDRFTSSIAPGAAGATAGEKPPTTAVEAEDDKEWWEDQKALKEEYRRTRIRMAVAERIAEEDYAATSGELLAEPIEDIAAEPMEPSVIDGTLGSELALLGGPSAAGKSLLAVEWALHLAAGQEWQGREVPKPLGTLWIASEGTHDVRVRWPAHPLWEAGRSGISMMRRPVNLKSAREVDRLIALIAGSRPGGLDIGLVVFDVIYGMGMADDMGIADALPVINALKRISMETGAGTLAIGHSGHGEDSRRFRGTSAWRQLALVEWFMGNGEVTCEKSKIGTDINADPAGQRLYYRLRYPRVEWMTASAATMTAVAREAHNASVIAEYVADHPTASRRMVAGAVKDDLIRDDNGAMGVSLATARRVVDGFFAAGGGDA